MPRVTVGTSDFRAFAGSCRRAAPGLRTAVNRRLLAGATLIAEDARARNVSTQTTISVEPGRDAVAVVARGPRITGLLEDGNKGSSGGSTFRHPVFGNMDVWVTQPMHPFLRPAVRAKGPAALALIGEAIDETFRIAAEF